MKGECDTVCGRVRCEDLHFTDSKKKRGSQRDRSAVHPFTADCCEFLIWGRRRRARHLLAVCTNFIWRREKNKDSGVFPKSPEVEDRKVPAANLQTVLPNQSFALCVFIAVGYEFQLQRRSCQIIQKCFSQQNVPNVFICEYKALKMPCGNHSVTF